MILLCLSVLLSFEGKAQGEFSRTMLLMGSRFDITVVAGDSLEGQQFIDMAVEEIQRIESYMSSWIPSSETSEVNRLAGIKPVEVSGELFQLIERAISISKLTDGAFDISYASMDRIWKFDGSMTKKPSEDEILASVALVGYQNILLDKMNSTVFLAKPGMKIGFGAIGKGYAADKAKKLLMNHGVKGGIVNASGDMNTWGTRADVSPWKIAITNPMNKDKVFAVLPLRQGAVVTSGDYEKYVSFDGKRYAHIINPLTGYPAAGIISATVFAPQAELADALATSIFVMGVDVGLNLIEQLPGVECIIIDDSGMIHSSKNIQIEKQ
jgi:thiamine biosynthesis lipoprotein